MCLVRSGDRASETSAERFGRKPELLSHNRLPTILHLDPIPASR
jgi:hypothetical protein